ncbi:hypothetical protein CDIK_0600 [Cucumispora dikerogammari]|nr:hypothetical protein CDIK_0600 [Cucumispora dikerogammari]
MLGTTFSSYPFNLEQEMEGYITPHMLRLVPELRDNGYIRFLKEEADIRVPNNDRIMSQKEHGQALVKQFYEEWNLKLPIYGLEKQEFDQLLRVINLLILLCDRFYSNLYSFIDEIEKNTEMLDSEKNLQKTELFYNIIFPSMCAFTLSLCDWCFYVVNNRFMSKERIEENYYANEEMYRFEVSFLNMIMIEHLPDKYRPSGLFDS